MRYADCEGDKTSFQGYQNGIPIYDYLEEVPDQIIESGQKFALLYPPDKLIQEKGGTAVKGNSFTLSAIIGYCILITFIGTFTVLTINALAYLFQGRPGQKVDDNLFEGGDGSVWTRNPETGEWEKAKGGTITPVLWIIIAIALIFVAVLFYLAYMKTRGAKSSSGSKKKKTKKSKPAGG